LNVHRTPLNIFNDKYKIYEAINIENNIIIIWSLLIDIVNKGAITPAVNQAAAIVLRNSDKLFF